MKQCPTCSTKNPDNASFCQCCGKSLEYVSGGTNTISSAVGDIFNAAKGVLQEGLDKLAEPSKTPYPPQYSTGYTPSAAVNQPGGGWNEAVHVQEAPAQASGKKKYPFFQDEDETTVAVLGESAIDADLGGTFQKSYAVLTNRRLYCKNDTGNFVSEISALEAVGINIKTNPFQWAFWVSIIVASAISILMFFVSLVFEKKVVSGLLYGLCFAANMFALVFRAKGENNKMTVALVLGSLGGSFASLIFAVLYIINKQKADAVPDMFFISCRPNRFFFYSLSNYPQQEIDSFYKVAIQLGAVSRNSGPTSSTAPSATNYAPYSPYGPPQNYRSSGGGTKILVAICALLIIAAIGFYAYNYFTHCKVSGCGNEIYKNGYCTAHYYKNSIDSAAGNVFDFFSN